MPPTIKELVVYTPAKDFELSKRFYAALGFTQTEGWGDTVDCRLGGAVFRLQNYYVKDWAENFMMKFDVEDIEAWQAHAKSVIDEGDFAHARYDRIETVGGDTRIFHVWDSVRRASHLYRLNAKTETVTAKAQRTRRVSQRFLRVSLRNLRVSTVKINLDLRHYLIKKSLTQFPVPL